MGSRLRGIKQEQGSHMYLQNIMVDDDSDEDIFNMIRVHARQNNLRIMSHKVIRNKYVWDVVGCKIVVPTSQEHMALNPGFWPCDILCRRWERLPPKNARAPRYGQDRSHTDDRRQDEDWGHYGDRYD
jgi:hypothetical protein